MAAFLRLPMRRMATCHHEAIGAGSRCVHRCVQGSRCAATTRRRRGYAHVAGHDDIDSAFAAAARSRRVHTRGRRHEDAGLAAVPCRNESADRSWYDVLGYARPKQTYVQDAHVGDRLPTTGKSQLQAVGGVWPEIAAVLGEKELAEYAGPRSVLFLQTHGALSASKAVFDDVPRLAATSKGIAYLFVPSTSYFIAGLDVSLCGQSAPSDLPVLAIRGDQKLASPRGAASFHPQALVDDASGNGFLVGADMCRPGAFIAALDASPVHVELVPGSDACNERTSVEGMPFTHARLFPRSIGGLYALLVNTAASTYYPDDAKRRTGPCAAPPRVIERLASGAWSAARVLPERVSYIDPAGTAWALTDHRTVLRVSSAGDTQAISPDATCVGDIADLVVPFPDQPWITVESAGQTALCVANLDVP